MTATNIQTLNWLIGACGILMVIAFLRIRLILELLVLQKKLEELDNTVKGCEERFARTRSKVLEKLNFMTPSAVASLNRAEIVLTNAKNLLELAYQQRELGNGKVLKELLEYRFPSGEIVNQRYDGTSFLLPDQKNWKRQFDNLLMTVNQELKNALTQHEQRSVLNRRADLKIA